MPRLSIVIVAGAEASAASMRAQDLSGVEIVETPDASAGARNDALGRVTGDYVWFVEPQDFLLPGALARLVARLDAKSPDVLFARHASIDARGRIHQGPRAPARWPALAGTAPRGWNKLLRTDHVRALGVAFAPGRHGALPVMWPALLAAKRIGAEPRTAFVHVRGTHRPPTQLDVFAAYDAVFAAVPDERRALVVGAMLRHELWLLGRAPAAERREFFHRTSEAYRRYRTGDEQPPAGPLGRLRWALVERDDYRAFRLLERARAGRRALPSAISSPSAAAARRRRRARRSSLERHYRERLRQPVDPNLAVFAAYWFRGYSCNPRAIYEKARELLPDMRGVWVVKPGAAGSIPPGVEYVVADTDEYFDVIARAGVFVNNVGFPEHLVKREGTTHLLTHHGTPLKHMGLDLQRTVTAGRRMNIADVRRRAGRWDYSLSQNVFSTEIWERVYPGSYESLEVGYPRNDVLATATADAVRKVRADLGIEPGTTAVLYAPTHREYEPGYLPALDLARVADALGPDHVVLARPHYFYAADPLLRELHRAGKIHDVAGHSSIEELCLAADVLVTDYSSIMFDYAVLDRPIVIHAPDWELYRALRGTYFDLMAEPPGVVARTDDELIEALRSRSAWGEEASRLRAAFRARFCSLEDGRAAERVVRRLWPQR